MTPPARLELWQHVTGSRYIVLSNVAGVQMAAGPLTSDEIAAAQVDEASIPWARGRGLATWIEQHRGEFAVVWPQEVVQ